MRYCRGVTNRTPWTILGTRGPGGSRTGSVVAVAMSPPLRTGTLDHSALVIQSVRGPIVSGRRAAPQIGGQVSDSSSLTALFVFAMYLWLAANPYMRYVHGRWA